VIRRAGQHRRVRGRGRRRAPARRPDREQVVFPAPPIAAAPDPFRLESLRRRRSAGTTRSTSTPARTGRRPIRTVSDTTQLPRRPGPQGTPPTGLPRPLRLRARGRNRRDGRSVG
jgi:hypothetical protein